MHAHQGRCELPLPLTHRSQQRRRRRPGAAQGAPFGFAVGSGGLVQVADAPCDREQDGAAADDVHEVHQLSPREPRRRGGRVLVDDHNRDVDQHLHSTVRT